MRRLAVTLITALLLVINPGLVFVADASPGDPPEVDTASKALAQTDADLGLPVDVTGKIVQYAQLDVTHRSGVAAVTWPGSDPAEVFLRQVIDGEASDWASVDVDPADPTEPGNGKGGTDPFVIAGVDSVEAVTVAATNLAVTLSLYTSPQTATKTIGVATAEAAESYAWSNPQILSRASWGADESLVRYAYTYSQVTGAMIHHTAGTNTYTQADVPGILRSIQKYHVTGRGWNDMAYNFLVDKYGRAWEGRGGGVTKAVQGGHAYGLTNARTTGISLMGNYQTAQPASAMLETAERVIAWKFALHGVDPNGTTYGSGGQDGGSTFLNAISGHRDENATDCPGQYVYSQFGTIRSKVASYLPTYKAALAAPTAKAGPDQSVSVGATVTLDASASTTGSTFSWKQTAGTAVTLTGPTTAKPTFKPTAAGTYTFAVTVAKGGLNATDSVVVTVNAAGVVNLARTAGVTITASSQDTTTASTAAKVADGSASGYPVDDSKEWTTLAGKAGSWVKIAFPAAVTTNKVVLYDRINTNDHVTAGTLTFSDGSTVNVGSLDNAGGATTVTFAQKTTTSVTFTATTVAATTENVGLAEFEVWGSSGTTSAPVPTSAAPTTVKPTTVAPTSAAPTTVKPTTAAPKPTTVAPSPTPSVTLTNLARTSGVTVTASSQDASTTQTAAKAIDGSTLGYPTDHTKEWATVEGKAGSWIQLTWASPVTLSKVVLYDRPNTGDRVTAGSLVFSGGSSVAVGSLDNAGAATTITFAARTVTSVRFNITSVASTTENIGLAEFQAWGTAGATTAAPVAATTQVKAPAPSPSPTPTASAPTATTVPTLPAGSTSNLARVAAATASSQDASTSQTAAKAIDGSTLGYPTDSTREWATVAGKAGSWIQLTWPHPVTLDKVVLHDRPNASDRVSAGTLVFSDGSTVPVGSLDNAGAGITVGFAPRTVTSVRLNITTVAAATENIGLAEFQAWGIAG